MSQVDLIATLTPNPGKIDRVVELFLETAEQVKQNEPGTLKYQIHREVNKKSGIEEVVIVETYANKQAFEAHGAGVPFKAVSKKLKEEDLTDGKIHIKFLKAEGGFARL